MTTFYLLLVFFFIFFVRQFTPASAGHDANVPAISIYALAVARWTLEHWYLTVPALAIDTALYVLLASLGPKLNWLATVWAFLIMLGTILLLGILAVGGALLVEHMPLGR